MNSGFWQVPMSPESKQYTAFTLGSMGLYECESMPFGLCNAPPTFQRLMLNCLGELNLTYCLIYLDDVIVFSHTEEEHLERMRVIFDRLREHGLKLKPSKCEVFRTEINYLAHHVSKKGVQPSKKNLESIAQCPPPDTYTKVKSFVGLVGHYRRFIKGFARIAAPLYDLTSGENKDKKSERVDLPAEALEAFEHLKAACLQAPILAFPDFNKPFLLETDVSGKGLGAVLSQKQTDGRYHPIAYASRIMNDTEQRYHSNKQEFLALKWAVTEQFHEYLSPYGKNRNEFVVRTDNNPLTYIFSSTNLDAAGQRWVAQLASYNFSLEYQKGKDNTVADFLSRLDETLPKEEVQDYLDKIPYPGVKAVLDNAITPLEERAEVGVRPDPEGVKANPEEAVAARAAKLASTNIIDWKVEQKDDPVLYQVVKHLRASRETFKGALLTVLDKKATTAYVKAKEHLLLKNGLLYRKTNIGPAKETIFQFVVPQRHRSAAMDGCHHEAAHQGQRRSASLMQERFWWPGMARDLRNRIRIVSDPEGVKANPEEAVAARAAKLASTNIIDWKVEQKDDPVLYQVVKHLRASRETFKGALLTVLDKKATTAYVKAKEQLLLKNGLLYRKTNIGPVKETIFQFVVPQRHRSAAMDGCHREAAHQGQRRSASLMQERFWWPGMARDLCNRIRKCGRCRKFEAAPPIAPMQPLTCSGPGELLHVDFTSIEETVPLKEEPVIRNVLVLQDHFSKYVVAYVVKDQTARTAAVTLRNGYFGLFGAPAYLVSDQGKAFTGHLITHLCELYGVHKLRTSPYHAQTNGQVERMNQTIIRMIGKLAEDKKARWSEHLPELLSAYNGTRSAVTGYSPYYLLFGRKNRMPVDCLFPTLYESPHRTKMEVSVATMQKRLKEAFEVARHLTYEEATKQCRYYDRRAGAVTLQPGDVVMVRTDSFVGKRKVKDRWEDGGFIVESQLGDWPVYKVRCPSADDRQKPKYRILHRNRLLLVADEDVNDASGHAQAKATPTLPNATHEALSVGVGSQESLPSLVTRQGGELTSMVWLNGEFRTKPWTQVVSGATPSPPDLHVDEVSGDESTEPEGT